MTADMHRVAAWQLRMTVGARRRCRLALIIKDQTPDRRGSVLVSEGGQFLLSLDTVANGHLLPASTLGLRRSAGAAIGPPVTPWRLSVTYPSATADGRG